MSLVDEEGATDDTGNDVLIYDTTIAGYDIERSLYGHCAIYDHDRAISRLVFSIFPEI